MNTIKPFLSEWESRMMKKSKKELVKMLGKAYEELLILRYNSKISNKYKKELKKQQTEAKYLENNL